jgi:hypothetical protein
MGTKVERRKIEGMNQFGLKHIYTWKCHNEIPFIAILNKHKCLFFFQKWKTRRQNRSCLGVRTRVCLGGCEERVQEGKYGRNVMYTCMKMEK